MAYVLTGQNGNTVRFEPYETGVVEKESESYSSSVTSNPIEDGSDINDHVNNAAGTLNITKTTNAGTTTVAIQSVSSSSVDRHAAAYTSTSSAAPLSRQTGGYDGLTV